MNSQPGSTVDIQNLADAYAWLRNDPNARKAWFREMSWYCKSHDRIPRLPEASASSRDSTLDDRLVSIKVLELFQPHVTIREVSDEHQITPHRLNK